MCLHAGWELDAWPMKDLRLEIQTRVQRLDNMLDGREILLVSYHCDLFHYTLSEWDALTLGEDREVISGKLLGQASSRERLL